MHIDCIRTVEIVYEDIVEIIYVNIVERFYKYFLITTHSTQLYMSGVFYYSCLHNIVKLQGSRAKLGVDFTFT